PYKIKNLSIGVNTNLVFGNLEKRLYLIPNVVDSYYINTRTKIHVTDVIFTMGAQYDVNLKGNSKVTLGTAFNLGSKLNAKRDFEGYKVNSSTNDSEIFTSEVLNRGSISYPFRITGGAAYDYKNRWKFAGDYTFQKMSDYKEFGKEEEYDNYHKIALGFSWYPAPRFGDIKWWQRNRYTIGGYGVRSHLYLKENYIDTYAITFGTQIPFYIQSSSLLLGVAFDLGIRGVKSNGLIQEKYAKIRLNITFKEGWFMKRKIY
ncbi:MAG: hypothetical protein LIO65_01900, partial [Odoribacter sp.]|nr:hypothetical protein [Odoribacter sp.]